MSLNEKYGDKWSFGAKNKKPKDRKSNKRKYSVKQKRSNKFKFNNDIYMGKDLKHNHEEIIDFKCDEDHNLKKTQPKKPNNYSSCDSDSSHS